MSFSVNTNAGAMTALQYLSLTQSQLNATQKATLLNVGINPLGPWSGFPIASQSVRQALRAFPQYSGAFFSGQSGPFQANAPQGLSWYDGLQITATKRLSHGLSVNANYTYSKSLSWTSPGPDIFNPILGKNYSGTDLPHQFRLSADYTTPTIHASNKLLGNKFTSFLLSGWGTGWFLQYQSAGALPLPGGGGSDPINSVLGRGQLVGLVANHAVDANGNALSPWSTNWFDYNGVHHTDPIDINCGCFNPQTTQVLNPAAWTLVPNGEWSTNYSTNRRYRGFRSPTENVNFSRNFRVKEKVNILLRVEFANALNRARYSSFTFANTTTTTPLSCSSGAVPSGGNQCALASGGTGIFSGGFGTLVLPSTGQLGGARTGNLVLRVNF